MKERKERIEKMIEEEIERLRALTGCQGRNCEECRYWFYPCGYRAALKIGFLNGEVVFDGGEVGEEGPAPTYVFDTGDCILEVGRKGYWILPKKGGDRA